MLRHHVGFFNFRLLSDNLSRLVKLRPTNRFEHRHVKPSDLVSKDLIRNIRVHVNTTTPGRINTIKTPHVAASV